MTVLQDIEWEACLLQPTRDPALERFVRQEMGGVPPIVPYFEVCPWIVRSLMAINHYRVRLVHVSFALAWGALATLGVVAAALAIALLRTWHRAGRLRERLDIASAELERLEHAFARFAPHAVVEEVIARGVSTQGERKEVTVLFADLVGFTPLTERVDPATLVRILNGYFERMSRAISEHQGHISTLIGDGILALFGAVEPNPWQSNDALHAALAMRAALADYNRELAADGLPPLALGVGLHRGVGVAGLVGSQDLVQFTVVGSTVNIAARVQDLTRVHGVDILATEPVRAALDPRFRLRALAPTPLRGIAEPVQVWAVQDFAPARAAAR